MLPSLLITLTAGAASVAGYPGMENLLSSLETRQAASGSSSTGASTSLIGDLTYLTEAQLTPAGVAAKQILNASASGQSTDAYPSGSPPPALGTPYCAADTCCAYWHISAAMAKLFRGPSGRCTDLARQAVRLGFHDAAGWAVGRKGGGADGSIVLAAEEMKRPANRGLEQIVAQMIKWQYTYSSTGVSMADLIQLGATTAAVVCPLGPRVRFFAGRKDSYAAAPDGLLPGVDETADVLVARFANMTIGAGGLVALVGAHTTSQQRFVDPYRAGDPQDSTPGVWDVLFYGQTLDAKAPKRVFKFQSDVYLSKDPRTAPGFNFFAGKNGQAGWNEAYSREYVRLSLLGVDYINSLTECSKALPAASPGPYNPPDQAYLNSWMQTTTNSQPVAQALMNGDFLSGLKSIISGLLGGLLGGRDEAFEA